MGVMDSFKHEKRELPEDHKDPKVEAVHPLPEGSHDEQLDHYVIGSAGVLLLVSILMASGPFSIMRNEALYKASVLLRGPLSDTLLKDVSNVVACLSVVVLIMSIATLIYGVKYGKMQHVTVTEVADHTEKENPSAQDARLLLPSSRSVDLRSTTTKHYSDWTPQTKFQRRYGIYTLVTGVVLLAYAVLADFMYAEMGGVPDDVIRAVNNVCMDTGIPFAKMDCTGAWSQEEEEVTTEYNKAITTTHSPAWIMRRTLDRDLENIMPVIKAILRIEDAGNNPVLELLDQLEALGNAGCHSIHPLCIPPGWFDPMTSCVCGGDEDSGYVTDDPTGTYCNTWNGNPQAWCFTKPTVTCGGPVTIKNAATFQGSLRPSDGPCASRPASRSALILDIEHNTLMSLRLTFLACAIGGFLCLLAGGYSFHSARRLDAAHGRALSRK